MSKKNSNLNFPTLNSTHFRLKKAFSLQQNPQNNLFSINSSIKKKFILTFISFAIIPFIFLCVIYTVVSKNALRTTSSTLNLELVHQVTNNLNTTLSTVEQNIIELGANSILNSGHLKKLVSSDKQAQTNALLGLRSIISSKAAQFLTDDTCLVLPERRQAIGSITNYTTEELLTLLGGVTDSDFHWVISDQLNSGNVLIYKKFTDISSSLDYYIVTKMSLSSISNYLGTLSLLKDSTVYLSDAQNQLLYSSDETATALPTYILEHLNADTKLTSIGAGNHLFAYDTLENGWRLVVQTPHSSLTEQLDLAFPIIFMLFIVIIILAIILGYFYANTFAKPIIHLMKLMGQAEQGDLTIKAPVKGKDEIAELCNSFNHMMHNIKTLINQTQEVITYTLESSETLTQSATHSVTTIKELATAVSEISQGTTSQAIDTQKSTQDMQGLAVQMDTVGSKTSTLLSNTEGAKSMIEGASSIMQSLTTTMSSSLNMTNDICTSISELNSLNQDIESIMQLVDGISGQTNLLALNASIEAARVGEAGRGFAVVANEVRHLADRSKASTTDVRTTLTTIERKMQETVQLAENSKHIIHQQEAAVKDTYALFHQIIDILSSMLNELQDVNDSVNAMRDLKEVMLTQIDHIASVTEESATSTEEVSHLAAEQQSIMTQFSSLSSNLADNMEKLNQTIKAFKVTT